MMTSILSSSQAVTIFAGWPCGFKKAEIHTFVSIRTLTGIISGVFRCRPL